MESGINHTNLGFVGMKGRTMFKFILHFMTVFFIFTFLFQLIPKTAIADKSMMATGRYHAVVLRTDGTVVGLVVNSFGQCIVSAWNDIVQVAVGRYHTVVLRSDGTAVAVGYNHCCQCDVTGSNDIVQVAAGGFHSVGLKSDGTVVAAGDNYWGQCDVNGWNDIVKVSADQWHTVGLKSDGAVMMAGNTRLGQRDIHSWNLEDSKQNSSSAHEANVSGTSFFGCSISVLF